MFVLLDNQAIRSLNHCNLNVVAFNITSAKIEYIRITQACEALEEKNITHSVQSLLDSRYLELSEFVQLLPS